MQNIRYICYYFFNMKCDIKYTDEQILESAKKYNNQRDWKNNDLLLFQAANNRKRYDLNFWNKCISHMSYIFKPNGYWTYERCQEVSKKYENIQLFRKEQLQVYNKIKKMKWDNLISHLKSNIKPNGYWTFEICLEASRKYSTRGEMSKNDSTPYHMILKNKWDDVCFSHMKRGLTLKERHIYAFEFNNTKFAYIGLTCQVERRKNAHLGKESKYGRVVSNVYHHMVQHNEEPLFKLLTDTPVHEEIATKLEDDWIKKYISMGYKLLNKTKAGSLGMMKPKWTYEIFLEIKKNCTTIEEFKNKLNSHSINLAKRNKWWEELTKDLIDTGKPITEWTYEKVIEESKKYNSISEIQKERRGLYKAIIRLNLKKTLFPINLHEKRIQKFSKENCTKEALKYKTRKEFKDNSKSYYNYASYKKWMKDICSHMNIPKPIKKINIINKEDLLEDAKKYNSIKDWKNSSRIYWRKSTKLGREFMEQCKSHMIPPNEQKTKWTKDKILIESKKYIQRWEWRLSSRGSYDAALRYDKYFYEECVKHMLPKSTVIKIKWTKEKTLLESKKYNQLRKCSKNSKGSYNAALRYGKDFYEECTNHMLKRTKNLVN